MCSQQILDKTPCYGLLQFLKEPATSAKSTKYGQNQVNDHSFEVYEKKLNEILKQNTTTIDDVFNLIEKEFTQIEKTRVFVRALASAVSSNCLDKNTGLNEIKLTKLCPLLSMFIVGNEEFEAEAIFSIKSLQKINQYPTGNCN